MRVFKNMKMKKGKRMCMGKPEKTVYKPLGTLRVPL